VARRPSVFVRPLSMEEGRKLARITRTAQGPGRLRRAIVVMMSGQGQTVSDITGLLQVSDDYVRDVIHAFNERGFDAPDPKRSGGRPRKIGDRIREWICLIARTSPAECGITAFSTWSLTKLRAHLLGEGIVAELSRETLRRILHEGGVSWQTTTTWKGLDRPGLRPKMRRILELYDRPPDDGRVVCVDEFGPLNLQPRKGKTWQRRRKPVTGVALLVGVAVAAQVEAARAGRPDLLLADTDDALEVLPRLRTQPRSGVAHAGIARSVRNCARSFQILSRSVVRSSLRSFMGSSPQRAW
jgi:transposase